MSYELGALEAQSLELSAKREWLLTNGIGGFAMGTASGVNTRRYHGHLVAALNPPTDRTVLLANIDARVQTDGDPVGISAQQYVGAVFPDGYRRLKRVRVGAFAEWQWGMGAVTIRKRLALHPGENACTVEYVNQGSRRVLLILNPLVSHKPYHQNFRQVDDYPAELRLEKELTRVGHDGVELILSHPDALRIPFAGWYFRFEHAREKDRELDPIDDLFCPCELRYELAPGERAVLTASVGSLAAPLDFEAMDEPDDPWEAAGNHFLIRSPQRTTIIAGYPWFTDWGRDTMIALPGICLVDRKLEEARAILRSYAERMEKGLIPNRFVEDRVAPDYNTVDATLWFANAIWKTLETEWDEPFAREMLVKLEEMIDWHRVGTKFGIIVDPTDGLLTQGETGWQLTWMDAKIGDWVVTPRHGKPVEINGLWINALRITEALSQRLGRDGTAYGDLAAQAELSFDRSFWCEANGWYFDTIDPNDAQLRPNQLIAMGLPFGPAVGLRAVQALNAVEQQLLTPYGLRTLGPEEIHYRGRFEGGMHDLDSAYHQGTVWPWLFGPYVDAVLKLTGDVGRAERALAEVDSMLADCGMGGVAEVYDGDAPQRPNGCPWQAWSVAEIVRARAAIKNFSNPSLGV